MLVKVFRNLWISCMPTFIIIIMSISTILVSSQNGHLDIVKLLLKNNRVNPADNGNLPIYSAFMHHHKDILNLLWNDKRVKKSLKKDYPDLLKLLLFEERQRKIKDF